MCIPEPARLGACSLRLTLRFFALCSVPGECPAELVAIMHRCFAIDPAPRPSAAELVDLLSAVAGPLPPPVAPAQLSSRPASLVLQSRSGMRGGSSGSGLDSAAGQAITACGSQIDTAELETASCLPSSQKHWQQERQLVLRQVSSASPFAQAQKARQLDSVSSGQSAVPD